MAYATVDAVRQAASGIPGLTDPPASPTHTPADLPNSVLNDLIAEADATINTYIGARYVTPVANDTSNNVPHPLDYWSRNIATYNAWLTFRKGKDLTDNDPAVRRYAATMAALDAISKSQIDIPVPEIGTEADSPSIAGQAINQYEGVLFVARDFSLVEQSVPGWFSGRWWDW